MIANMPYKVFERMRALHMIPHADINVAARNRAMEVLCAVPGVDMINPSPDEEGGISLEWILNDHVLLVDVDNDGGAHTIHELKSKYSIGSIKPYEDSWRLIMKVRALIKEAYDND